MATIFGFLYMGCTMAPPEEYDWTVHLRRRCGLMSNYFDHLLLLFTTFVQLLLEWCVVFTLCLKNVPHLTCYNFDAHECILIFFGRDVTDKVGNQKTHYSATSKNLCFCTTWQNENHIFHSIGLCYTHNAPAHYLPERKKIVICEVFDSA